VKSETRTGLVVWLALLGLLGLTLASSYVPMDGFNAPVNIGIAAAKAALVGVFFMRLRYSGATVRLALLTAALMVAVMMGLSFADILTRGRAAAPPRPDASAGYGSSLLPGGCVSCRSTRWC